MLVCGVVVFFFINTVFSQQDNNIKQLNVYLNKTLHFVEEYYYEMNLDGLLGLTLAEGKKQLKRISDCNCFFFLNSPISCFVRREF